MGTAERQPTILHLDMDAFYASIEQRDDPTLRGRPVIVGGTGRRGVVSAASYEARVFGVHSAQPTFRARERCPQAVFLPPRIRDYVAVSRQLMELLDGYSPVVEPLSLDEAFLDMTGTERLFGPPDELAGRLQRHVRTALDLTCSIGVAPTKFVAKVASDLQKPNGITICPHGRQREFLAPLPLERIWGVGPRASESLRRLGLATIGDVATTPEDVLTARFGSFGTHIWRLANGVDDRSVHRRRRSSHGAERTLSTNIQGRPAVKKRLVPLADEVARGLRARGRRAIGVRLKLKYADFRTVTRDTHVPEPIQDAESMLRALDGLLDRVELDLPIRLVGLSAFDLSEPDEPVQTSLFGENRSRREALETTLDGVAARFGRGAVVRGSSLDDGESS